jgi:hypothetical protein
MTHTTLDSKLRVYAPSEQGTGAFDNGRITEIKPIGFPGEGGAVDRVGPLFYWAWATAEGPGEIGLHPHRAFEIVSYVLEGELGHYDTLGTRSRVGAGGAQVMQTGSGVSHEEAMLGESGTRFFQIWFEPNLRETLLDEPKYFELPADELPAADIPGGTVKTIIGADGPVQLRADVALWDLQLEPDARHTLHVPQGRRVAAVTVDGAGAWSVDDNPVEAVRRQDFTILGSDEDALDAELHADPEHGVRLVGVEVPNAVPYPLLRK